MTLQIFIILFCYVYTVFSEISFIPNRQRAEIFEITDNEVPIFKVTLPEEEFLDLKERGKSSSNINFNAFIADSVNNEIQQMINMINKQNLFTTFPNTNFSEIVPELPVTKNGFANIDSKDFSIDENYVKRCIEEDNLDIIIYKILVENSNLNIIKVSYLLSEVEMSINIDKKFKKFLYQVKEFSITDGNGNVSFDRNKVNQVVNNSSFDSKFTRTCIKELIEFLNRQNLLEAFPNTNFTETLPELPMTKKGYPTIDDTKYSCTEEDIKKLDDVYDDDDEDFIIFNIINDDAYINIVKVFYILSQLDMSSKIDHEFKELIYQFTYPVSIDENGKFNFDKEMIKEHQNNSSNANNSTNSEYDGHIDKNYNIFKNFNTKEFYDFIKSYNFNNHEAIASTYFGSDFKTKNASMAVEINNQELIFNKITFSIGGQYSSVYPKPGFNVKIRGHEELFGRRQFKLRADATEPSYIRTKLVCDIHNRLGIPSLSANYITLYINNEYMGLYILTDAFKESWIEYVYGEKDTAQLYKSESGNLSFGDRRGFKNENKDITDYSELYKFLAAITKAKTASDVESIFDLDQFYKEIALEFLMYGWDHIGHNFYLYQNNNNHKWIYLIHDFDFDMGVSTNKALNLGKDITEFSMKDMEFPNSINRLIESDEQKFNETLKEIVNTTFNPEILFPHIDEIKAYIEPYVKLDKTPNEKGEYPGVINKNNNYEFFTYKQWNDSTEYDIVSKIYYGLKRYILLRYRYICTTYAIQCDQNYMDDRIIIKVPIDGLENNLI